MPPTAPAREVAERVYRDLVKQARTPSFYRDLGVPDTPEGRFEMVGLHVALVVRRLRTAGAPGSALAQELFDLLFADVDEGLRHIGVGDLAVGKHVKRLAGYFYARLRALDEALDAVPGAPLAPMLRTNVYHNAAGAQPAPAGCAGQLSDRRRGGAAGPPDACGCSPGTSLGRRPRERATKRSARTARTHDLP